MSLKGNSVESQGENCGDVQVIGSSAYYTATFQKFGPSARGVDWSTEEGQELRFRQLDAVWVNAPDSSICDFGCGYGAYAQHLARAGHQGEYLGVDVSEDMVRYAQQTWGNRPQVAFVVGHCPVVADIVIASGTFNVIAAGQRRDWERYVWRMIHDICGKSRVGFAFNLIREPTSQRFFRESLFWASPTEVLQRLTAMNLDVTVLQDYGLHEATYLAVKG